MAEADCKRLSEEESAELEAMSELYSVLEEHDKHHVTPWKNMPLPLKIEHVIRVLLLFFASLWIGILGIIVLIFTMMITTALLLPWSCGNMLIEFLFALSGAIVFFIAGVAFIFLVQRAGRRP